MNTYDVLTIMRLPEGGWLVHEAYRGDGYNKQFLFASTTIEEALKFINRKLTK